MPTISFIIPTYNYGEHILDAIESVFSVMQDNDELIVIDDGSEDDTHTRLKPLLDQGRILYHYQENRGVSTARNHGAELAVGDHCYFLDADDRILSDGFSVLRKVAGEHPDTSLVFGGHVTVEGEKRREHRQMVIDSQLPGSSQDSLFIDYVVRRRFSIANGGTALVRRDVALRYPYPTGLRVSEDFCVYAWILANEAVRSIPEPIVEIKKHPASLRNQLAGYEQVIESLPGILFTETRLPAALMSYRHVFYCNRLLSLFRAQYLAGVCKAARKTYHKAIQCRKMNIFKLSYLRKYLRCLMSQ